MMDALGANIRVDARGREVLRILPRNNDAVNEEWISDKTRYVVDGLRTQRLDRPYIRRDGRLLPASWEEALQLVGDKLKATTPERIAALAGTSAPRRGDVRAEGADDALGSPNIDCRQDGAALDPSLGRASYLFNPTVAGIEQTDVMLVVGSNPRLESPVLNARIRKRWRQGGCASASSARRRRRLALRAPWRRAAVAGSDRARRGRVRSCVEGGEKPIVLVGAGVRWRGRMAGGAGAGGARRWLATGVEPTWNGLAVLHTAAARVGGLDIGFVPASGGLDTAGILHGPAAGDLDVVFLLGADEIDMATLGKAFVVYQGTHGDAGAHRADVVLPGATYTEKSGTYVNTEGRVQMAARAGFPPGEAKEDWAMIRALSAVAGKTLPFDSLGELRQALYKAQPHLGALDQVTPAGTVGLVAIAASGGIRPAVRPRHRRFLLHQPDCPGIRRDGRAVGDAARPVGQGGGVALQDAHHRHHWRYELRRRPSFISGGSMPARGRGSVGCRRRS